MVLALSVEARCAHFGICGGCKSQHLPYDEQLAMKEAWIVELFGSCKPIIGCEEPWNWRNKMEFTFSQDRKNEHFLGLMMRGQRGKVLSLDECHIAQPWMVEVLQAVLAWWNKSELQAYYPPRDLGSLRYLTLREGINTGEKMGVLTVSGNPAFSLTEEDLSSFVEAVGPHTSLILRTQHLAPKTPTAFTERVLFGRDHIFEILHGREQTPYTFKIRAPSFFQPNTLQAERLYLEALKPIEGEEILFDLYCGTGTIGILASERAKKVIGIESVPEAASDAQTNLELNQVANMTVLQGQVEDRLADLPPPSAIIVDPPRVGLSKKAVDSLLSFKSKKIVYISCNPESQKKNIEELVGYEIVRVQPIDQFPHTAHLENIVFLESKG